MIGGFRIGTSVAPEVLPSSFPNVYSGDIHEIIEKCARLGYDGVELQIRSPRARDFNAIVRTLDRFGMKVPAITTGLEYSLNKLSMISDDPIVRYNLRENFFNDIDIAADLGSLVVIGCIRGNIPPGADRSVYLARFRDELLKMSDRAAKKGVTLVIEAINFYVNNYLCTVRECCDFVDDLGRDNVKVHIDTHHMAIEETDMFGAVRYAGKRVGYVHLAENNRMYPGATNGDYGQLMDILRETGYDGWLTFEITPRPDPDTAARNCLDHIRKVSEGR